MRNPVFKASSPNGALLGVKTNITLVLLASCLLFQCGASSFASQDDNDLVFEEDNLQVVRDQNPNKNNSSQVDPKFSNVVSLDDDILINTQNDPTKADEPLSERISQHINRFKRQLFSGDFWGGIFAGPTTANTESTLSTSDKMTTREKRSSTKTTRAIDEGDADPEDENDNTPEDTDDEDTTEPSFSGDPPVTVATQPSTRANNPPARSHFRVFIKLMEPYSYDFADHSSAIFKDYASNITTGVREALAVPDFLSARLVSVISIDDISQSKAIVDLEFSGAESKERIEGSLSAHLATEVRLGSLQATPVGLYVRDYGESMPFQCSSPSDIPCKDSDACYPSSGRCDKNADCPDRSDEENCPPLDRCRSDDKYPCPNSGGILICGVHKCDGKKDCPGGEDESSNCDSKPSQACLDEEFSCDGVCIASSKRCNGVTDCDDQTDEKDCLKPTAPTPAPAPAPTPTPSPKVPCREDEFSCDENNSCIPLARRCDNVPDCRDGTDEQECPSQPPPLPSPNPPPYEPPPPLSGDADLPPTSAAACNSTTEFKCRSADQCVLLTSRCDGLSQCTDRSDEENCPVDLTTTSVSLSTALIPTTTTKSSIATPLYEAPSKSSNRGTCRPNQITCYDGACIEGSQRCDGVKDCSQGEDEGGCTNDITTTSTATLSSTSKPCSSIEFQCKNGICISDSFRCDNFTDCLDNSDEENCPSYVSSPPPPPPAQCSSNQFRCGDGSCIDIRRKCNREIDCPDATDEADCARVNVCLPTEFRCNDGHCIPLERRCDKYPDCRDGSDEVNCVCNSEEFTCNDGHCVPLRRKCDGFPDCRDNSDESNCVPTTTPAPQCRSDEFRCDDGHCIPTVRVCDGTYDCRDYTDEYNCPPKTTTASPACPPGTFTCNITRQCVPSWARCNSRSECFDGSDEFDCQDSNDFLNLRAYPADQIIKASQEVVFQCRDEGPLRSPVTWIRGNGLPLPANSVITGQGRLEIPNIQVSHSGTYICRAADQYSNYQNSQVQVTLTVEPFVPITSRPLRQCGYNESTCLNGDCVRKELICNGQYDCADGSDEMRCSSHGCEPDQFRCANKMCIQKNWRCDGENDCKDGSDEANCAPNPPGSPCRHDEFQCANRTQCILKAFQCDGQNDCIDGTDEVGCSKVFISQPPPPIMQLVEGDTFIITCTAVGVPTPEIVWRLNWGHVPSKCTSTSVNGVGTLTCYDIRPSDAGAYSCEGINVRGFVVATPDCILIVNPVPRPGCPVGQFNDEAQSECIGCFCFGVTSSCKSANLFVYELLPPLYQQSQFSFLGVSYNPLYSQIEFNTNELLSLRTSVLSANSFQVKGTFYSNQGSYPYFSFLSAFNGNQLKSYGGYIKYNVRYDSNGSPLDLPTIILSGNANKIFYNGTQYFNNPRNQLVSSQSEQVSARLFYGSWFKEGSGRSGGGDQDSSIPASLASREEIMMILVNVDQAVLKIQSTDSSVVNTVVSNFKIDSAGATNTGLGKAAYVEQCSCPPGYSGLSCESCASGYSRIEGNFLGTCRRIESCPPGTYGDPLQGIQCQPCPCPSSNPTNQFGRTCFLDSDGQPTCQCPAGYVGRRCENCAPGYTGNPLSPGDYCKPIQNLCNRYGSLNVSSGPPCACKPFTTGYYCDQCTASAFYLAESNPYGCINCFCMGVSTSCSSSSWYRHEITTTFVRSSEGFQLVPRQNITQEFWLETRPNEREIVYSSFSPSDSSVYYWVLPSRYLGDKLTSYGGVLNYTLRYRPSEGSQPFRNNAPDVEIISNNQIRLFYYKRDGPLQPGTLETVSVPLLEQYWQRADGVAANRPQLLMALAGIKTILIKATYTTSPAEVALQSVTLEDAEDRNTGLRPAYEVEECRCPAGYRGLSCQECDSGYYRVDFGLYLGLCERCNCNGFSQDCDAETGACLNCANHTTGPNCGQCEPGYSGNPQAGQPCYPIDVIPCNCDPRGSLQAECVNGRCSCKENVIGDTCSTCRPGTFDLQASHRTGCLECWCSGVTNQCQASNLFVAQIPTLILDANHGFTLSQADRRPFNNPRFELDFARNLIAFDYTIARGQRLYWTLPSKYTGSKLSSYGGYLNWTQAFFAPADSVILNDYDLIIYGDGTSIFWSSGTTISPNVSETRTVKLEENEFIRVTASGTQRATRADILKVLSSVEAILIRATSRTQTSYVTISDVSLDTAVSQQVSSVRATQVETCKCPIGYRGLSCEVCQRGYYLDEFSNRGKECKKCPCNDHEEGCSIGANGVVVCKCAPGYGGTYCEVYVLTSTTASTTTLSTYFTTTLSTYLTTTSQPWPYYLNSSTTTSPAVPEQSTPPPGFEVSTDPNQEQTILITIREAPQQVVATGSVVRYHCRAQSVYNLPVSIKWSKEGGSLPPARCIVDDDGNLVLTNAIASDSGAYVCIASDKRTTVTQKVYLTVGEQQPSSAPRVTLTPSGGVTLIAGESLSISCVASGSPTPTIEFGKRDGRPATKTSRVPTAGVVIQSIQKSDEGVYYCRAVNSAGHDEQEVVVYVTEISSGVTDRPANNYARVRVDPRETVGLAGSTIRLQCSVESNAPYKVTWVRYPNLPLPSSAIERNGELFIYPATVQDAGVYICTAISDQGRVVLGQAEATVTIGDAIPPTVLIIEPEKQTVAQGTLAKLTCLVSGNPNARITWRKSNENIPAYAQTVGNELRIPQVDVKDRGVYLCEFNSGDGSLLQAHSILEVMRREAPAVIIYPNEKQQVSVGGAALLQCQASRGEPSPTLRWSRPNNQPISSHVEVLDGVLRFTQIGEEDEGQYICTAQNLAGSVTAVATLEVTSPPVISLYPKGPSYIVTAGQPVRIECSATGKPTPSVYWHEFIGIEPKSSRNKTKTESQTAVIEITRAQVSDSGQYTCGATSSSGRVEEKIQLTVLPDQSYLGPTIGTSMAPDEEIIFPLGSSPTIRCDVKTSSSNYNIQWIRENGNLPEKHRIYNGNLILYDVTAAMSGKYTCLGVGYENEVLFIKSVNLKFADGQPKISLNPARQTVRPGDNAEIECLAEGDQPIEIHWATQSGAPFTRSVVAVNGHLAFRGIAVNDAGVYVCTAKNDKGESKAVAEVLVSEAARPPRLTVKALEHSQTGYEGYDLDLKCVVNFPFIPHQITWRRERGPLPRNSQILGGTLRLINLRPEDVDRYICEVTSASGASSDFIDVQVEHISNVSLTIESSKDPIRLGDAVSLLCNVLGDADQGVVIWSKGDGEFENNVYIDKHVLRIADVQPANKGIYRCSTYVNGALKSADYRVQVVLDGDGGVGQFVVPPSPVDIKTAKYGENIDLDCFVQFDPPVNYSWIVHSYDKSLRRIVNSDKLTVQNLTVGDSGLYTCSATNRKTKANIRRVLVITDVIPAFSKNSYLTLRPLINAENHFEIEITFRPKSDTGLILHTGQKNDGTGDYVSFGLNNAIPEFRFDVGSGPAVIRGQLPLRMNTWNTVRLVRDKKEGFMEVNGRENRTGSSPGQFERLDLQFPLFVGGLPTDAAYNNSGFSYGFEGCVNRLLINNREANLKKEMIGANNLEDCDNCKENPCLNDGVCQQTLTASGYTCVCLPGHSGDHCELNREICYLDSCGTGKCIEHENGIECQCPVGKTGPRCDKSIDIETPAFLKNSWLAYQAPLLKKKFKLTMKLKPVGQSHVDDGLIFYIAEKEDGSGDYISLSISGSFAELKFKVLSIEDTLRSSHYFIPNEEVEVNVSMNAAQAMFSVGGEPAVAKEFNPRADSAELKLSTPLCVGGLDRDAIKLPDDLLVRSGFHGCISMLDVSGTNIKLLQSSITSSNINDCFASFGDICRSNMPCQNEGICKTTRDTYKCECAFGFSGANCERQKDMCEVMNDPCQNNAKCIGTANTFKCHCELGFAGEYCENRVSIEDHVNLNGDGFVVLPGSMLPHNEIYDITIDIYFTTRSQEALLFWNGQNENINGRDYDYIAVGINNGFVELSYKAGDIEKTLKATDHKINDGKEHLIRVLRRKEVISFELDRITSDMATLESRFNINGDIFLGGTPNTLMTGNLYTRGFVGCIHALTIQDSRAVNFATQAKSARNVQRCTPRSNLESNSIF